MRRKRHTPEQVVRKLREAETELAGGKTIEEVCKKLEVSQQTYFRWKKQYGSGTGIDEVRRLKELEKENQRLKEIVADLELDKKLLKEALKGNY
ncbi:MAG TPA: transposase [Tepidisphaeraceae bacterium]|jgi:transposase-like protein|nr:transposase [Tepidisphaeraceae bacterium]